MQNTRHPASRHWFTLQKWTWKTWHHHTPWKLPGTAIIQARPGNYSQIWVP